MEIPDVCRIFKNHDIFAVQETKGEINLEEYCCFNSTRSNSNSGGVCIGVHKSLKAGISRVKVDCTEDIVVVKLKGSFFNLEKDTNLINVYDSPTNGSFKKRMKSMATEEPVTTLEHLQEVAASIPTSEDIILLGDFNAQTGKISDILEADTHDNEDHFQFYDGFTPPERNNGDPKLNLNDRPFIELVQTLGLCILNGRTLGDVFGEPTCIQRKGVSTVDYVCTSPKLYRKVREFRVLGTTRYSDHRPLSLTLDANQPTNTELHLAITEGLLPAPAPFKWVRSDDPKKDTSALFQEVQRSQIFENNIDELLSRLGMYKYYDATRACGMKW